MSREERANKAIDGLTILKKDFQFAIIGTEMKRLTDFCIDFAESEVSKDRENTFKNPCSCSNQNEFENCSNWVCEKIKEQGLEITKALEEQNKKLENILELKLTTVSSGTEFGKGVRSGFIQAIRVINGKDKQ